MPDVADRGACYMDREGYWLIDTAYAISLKNSEGRKDCGLVELEYILGILNSRILTFFLKENGTALRGGYFRMKTAYLNPFPIRTIDFASADEKTLHDRVVGYAKSMQSLHSQATAAKTSHEQTALARQIEATDREIDRLVYELYGLTDDEIRIVEEATAG